MMDCIQLKPAERELPAAVFNQCDHRFFQCRRGAAEGKSVAFSIIQPQQMILLKRGRADE